MKKEVNIGQSINVENDDGNEIYFRYLGRVNDSIKIEIATTHGQNFNVFLQESTSVDGNDVKVGGSLFNVLITSYGLRGIIIIKIEKVGG